LAASGPGRAARADPGPPRIAIVLDDLGYARAAGERAIALPGPVACAILPDTPHAARLALGAREAGKEVLLHLPMAADDPAIPFDAGGIGPKPSRLQLEEAVRRGLRAVPYASGVNNHMGSLLTREPEAMAWLMAELRRLGWLYFLDSRTSAASVAARTAREAGVRALSRDVFLDADPAPGAVAGEFRRLIALAHRKGSAVAIGHPHEATLALLERELPRLETVHGVRLVAPGRLAGSGREAAAGVWPVSPPRRRPAAPPARAPR